MGLSSKLDFCVSKRQVVVVRILVENQPDGVKKEKKDGA